MTRIRLTEEEAKTFQREHEQMPAQTSFINTVARYHAQGLTLSEITDKLYRMRGGKDLCSPPWKLSNPNRSDDDYIALQFRVQTAVRKLDDATNRLPEPEDRAKERGGRI